MSEIVCGFRKPTAEALVGILSVGSVPSRRARRKDGPWRFFGKMEAQIEPGAATGVLVIWDDGASPPVATTMKIEGVKNLSEVLAPYDITKLVGITRSGYSGLWILDLEFCVPG